MRRSFKILLLAIMASLVVSCSDTVGAWDYGPQLNVNMERYGPSQGDTVDIRDLPPFTFATDGHELIVYGHYLAPSCGYTPGGVLKKDETISITIRRPKNVGAVCSMPAGFQYQAKITQLPKGNYAVNILHKNDLLFYEQGQDPGESWVDIAFSEEITIK